MAQPAVSVVPGSLTRELRRTVLRPQQAVGDPLPGDGDETAVHLAILDERSGAPLAACFVVTAPFPWATTAGSAPGNRPVWQLRSVATDPARQRTGLGTVLMDGVFEFVARRGGGNLWCNARTPAVPFYERLGLTTHGEEHESNGLLHYYMWRPVEPVSTA